MGIFPNAKISIVSLIPRKAWYYTHIRNMHKLNEWLELFCSENSCRFVNMFTHFLNKLPHIWELNRKLFKNDLIHFSNIGNSVLAKVLIGVANSPR